MFMAGNNVFFGVEKYNLCILDAFYNEMSNGTLFTDGQS